MAYSRRQLIGTALKLAATSLPLVSRCVNAAVSSDPRPEFAATSVEQAITFFFGTADAADDGSIEIVTPLIADHKFLVPFKIRAPGAEKIAVLFDSNTHPLLLAMDQIMQSSAVVVGRAQIERDGNLYCYVLRNGFVTRAARKISVSGHWMDAN